MKILFLSPVVPYPPVDGDRQRAYRLLSALCRRHETHLLCFQRSAGDQEGFKKLQTLCASVAGVPLARSRIWMNCLKAWPGALPLNVAAFQSPAMARRVRQSVENLGIDVVHAYRLRMAPYALASGAACRVLDYTDAMTRYFQNRLEANSRLPARAYLQREAGTLAVYEPAAARGFDASLISSPQDQAVLEKLGGVNIRVVTNGVDTAAIAPEGGLAADPVLLFVGNCNYAANVLELTGFFREAWPQIRRAVPNARLLLVGLGSDHRRFRHPGVQAAGRVPDLKPFLRQARVGICPLSVASGRQFKVIEYLAAGLPTVATPLVAANLDAKPDQHLLAGAMPGDFSRQVVRLCQDELLAQRLRKAGREFAVKYYDWTVAERQLQDVYASFIRQTGKEM